MHTLWETFFRTLRFPPSLSSQDQTAGFLCYFTAPADFLSKAGFPPYRGDLTLYYSDDLRLAHMMKEWFYDICQMKSYRRQQQEFDDWISNTRGCGISEFEKCAKTFQSWRKGILNAFKYGITNRATEGFNNKIKVLKRSSYGIRNFNRLRTRILHCTS